jgi:hypothetical protein
MKYLTFVWSVGFAGFIYLPLMLVIWLTTGSAPAWWIAIIVIALLAFVIHLVVLLRQDYKWRSEDVMRTDETVLANVETVNKRRRDAENYILASGDEDAIKVLKEAQAHYFTYNSILLNGMKKGNDTLKIALLILSGVIDGKDIPAELDHDIDEAMKKMEAKLFPMDAKKQW